MITLWSHFSNIHPHNALRIIPNNTWTCPWQPLWCVVTRPVYQSVVHHTHGWLMEISNREDEGTDDVSKVQREQNCLSPCDSQEEIKNYPRRCAHSVVFWASFKTFWCYLMPFSVYFGAAAWNERTFPYSFSTCIQPCDNSAPLFSPVVSPVVTFVCLNSWCSFLC